MLLFIYKISKSDMLFLLPVLFSALSDTTTRAQIFDPYAQFYNRGLASAAMYEGNDIILFQSFVFFFRLKIYLSCLQSFAI